jgi:hypothetical protein
MIPFAGAFDALRFYQLIKRAEHSPITASLLSPVIAWAIRTPAPVAKSIGLPPTARPNSTL